MGEKHIRATEEEVNCVKKFLIAAICEYYGPVKDDEYKYLTAMIDKFEYIAELIEVFGAMPLSGDADLFDVLRGIHEVVVKKETAIKKQMEKYQN